MSKRFSRLAIILAAGLMLIADWAGAAGGTAGSPVESTERNVRDKGNATLTPEDQLQNEGDLRITADVRKAITGDGSLSVNAHNAKVITRNGTVTLRGPVNSDAEKNKLQDIAQKTPGVNQVDNQLEVRAP
ncbi:MULTISPECIES: BON domain-containing protein [Methylomicrobium]|uniref:Putative periplasmic or secreted lipoprotein n=1 Tax=Methylomicrobium album BG8 TaxID=686340 RepID=H8GPQ5_METAL|nr:MULTISPECIES: BON domain-containing protein [Methylomicrobium]EIC28517.1 putative periplasmic or secreted lipoprotein [Methylomicrobium album BG8]